MARRAKTEILAATAFHEAGHAFLAVERKLPFHYVTIVDKDDSLGHLQSKAWPASMEHLDVDINSVTRKRIDSFVMMVLAGAVAERNVTGRRNHLGASADYDAAVKLGGILYPDSDVLMAYLKFVDSQLRSLLKPVDDWKESP
jgi:ATP-dependent Zn protease